MHIANYYHSTAKRIFDIVISLLLLLTISPLFLALAFVIYLTDRKPVIYTQVRLGKEKQKFLMYKFRTMKVRADQFANKLEQLNQAPAPMFKISNDPRFTSVGKHLSKLGLDELPQLLNVLKGEMSLVGPRPLPVQQANKLDKTWNYRYSVKPGIMSKWAISKQRYQSLNTWKSIEKEELKTNSLITELQLILNTFFIVVLRIKPPLID